jgi:uncharacterized membrane protein
MTSIVFTNAVHVLAAVIWVGGMFFAHMVLRPSAGAFEPPERLQLWGRVFSRFFPWVWAAVVALLATGYWQVIVVFGGFANAGLHVHLMHAIGLLMIALYVYLYAVPYRRFRTALETADWPVAGGLLNVIRRIVVTNLTLGLITIALGASGRYWI